MVVDDEEDVLFVVESMLREEGYDVVSCTSGEECLERIREENPDLVLMDIMMPGMDGWAATAKIKENPKTRHIPVAMLTVRASKEDKLRSFHKSKCDAYIVKPIDREELLKVSRWLLEGKR
jgi:CheY-like chemotaxis protein